MTTTYGTFPAAVTNRAMRQQIIRSGLLESRRPWKQMLSFSVPKTFADALTRLNANISYFFTNYAIFIMFLVFLCLLFRPVPLAVFVAVMAAWLFFYFLRDDPVSIFGYVVDERVVLAWLSIFTLVLLFLTVTVKVVVALVVGVVAVVVHGVFRKIDDSLLMVRDYEEGMGVSDSWPTPNVNLKGTAASLTSSSSSSSSSFSN